MLSAAAANEGKEEGRVGDEAIIAPNTTTSGLFIAAASSTRILLVGTGKGGGLSCAGHTLDIAVFGFATVQGSKLLPS